MAFEYGVTVAFFSTTTKSIPYRMSWHASESPVGPAPMMITSVSMVFISSSLPIKCHPQNTLSPPRGHGPKDVFLATDYTDKQIHLRNVSFGICDYTGLSSIFTPR